MSAILAACVLELNLPIRPGEENKAHISDMLRTKGSIVATISPTSTVAELLAELAHYNIGVMVIIDRDTVVGIVSERDVQ